MDIHQEDKLQWMNWLRDLGFQAHLPATLHTSELASRCARCDADQLVAQLRRDGLELPVVVKSEQKNQRTNRPVVVARNASQLHAALMRGACPKGLVQELLRGNQEVRLLARSQPLTNPTSVEFAGCSPTSLPAPRSTRSTSSRWPGASSHPGCSSSVMSRMMLRTAEGLKTGAWGSQSCRSTRSRRPAPSCRPLCAGLSITAWAAFSSSSMGLP
jgi:hypothetical protein